MEETKYVSDSYSEFDDKFIDEFYKLEGYTQSGEYQKIDKWFERNKISENPELENYIIRKIKEEEVFFSSFINYSTERYSKEEFNIERTKREIAILKNLSFKAQLKLLFSNLAIKDITSDHFKVIKITHENKKILESNENIVFLITKRFTAGEFTEIDEIQKILGFNVMEQKISTTMFCYDIQRLGSNSYGLHYFVQSVHLPINKPIFSPKCDIIFNYSEEKRKFLEERNITLPTIEEANNLYYEMLKTINDENRNTFIRKKTLEEKLEQSFKNYESIKLNLDLENELYIKNSLRKKKLKL